MLKKTDENASVAIRQEHFYTDHIVVFIDFLGFSEAINDSNESSRNQLLNLLIELSSMQGDFELKVDRENQPTKITMSPNITTFSDNLVLSYPLDKLKEDELYMEGDIPISPVSMLSNVIARIASEALKIGFLIRGGATIGKLYHKSSVVYGEAMVEAYRIESGISNYPRVVVSNKFAEALKWNEKFGIRKDNDGLYHLNYFSNLLYVSSTPGPKFSENLRTVYSIHCQVISETLSRLKSCGEIKAYSKWAWFAREFRHTLDITNPRILQSFGIDKELMPKP